MQRAFVIRGFGTKQDGKGQAIDFERVHAELIAPALQACKLGGGTTAEVNDSGNIRADMFALILEADVVVCDITVHNANVFYELGIRHSLRKKHTILIKGDPSADVTPFDLSTDRYLKYPVAAPGEALDALISAINRSMNTERDTDSPIFLMLPTLKAANPAEVMVTSLAFIEEVERAEACHDMAWLRVIGEDLAGMRYEREGLRRLGRAQWKLKDWAGARLSWEGVRKGAPTDIEANLALANIYERLWRETGRASLLTQSNQAILTVLDSPLCARDQRAEALALEGRNLKTLWRVPVEQAGDVAAAVAEALDVRALRAYASYRQAFECDLNAFYPGVAAMQMGVILRKLAEQPGWRNLFKGDEKAARRAQEDLEDELPELLPVVKAAVRRAQGGQTGVDPWADIAEVDLWFLGMLNASVPVDGAALARAYRDAIAETDTFAWDATLGQLDLFATLGMNADAVAAVRAQQAPEDPREEDGGEHLVVFAGHRIDGPGATPRFPAASEARARELIAEHITRLRDGLAPGMRLTVLASAAPGADILVHEVCEALGVSSRLCLPLPADAVATRVFETADAWRDRFWRLVEHHEDRVLQMTDHGELPAWLHDHADIDVWERGNRWVMHQADTWPAKRVSLLVLWDGADRGESGGTAQLVRLAKRMGRFTIDHIPTQGLSSVPGASSARAVGD